MNFGSHAASLHILHALVIVLLVGILLMASVLSTLVCHDHNAILAIPPAGGGLTSN